MFTKILTTAVVSSILLTSLSPAFAEGGGGGGGFDPTEFARLQNPDRSTVTSRRNPDGSRTVTERNANGDVTREERVGGKRPDKKAAKKPKRRGIATATWEDTRTGERGVWVGRMPPIIITIPLF